MPRLVIITRMLGRTICSRSRSPLTIRTSNSSSAARHAGAHPLPRPPATLAPQVVRHPFALRFVGGVGLVPEGGGGLVEGGGDVVRPLLLQPLEEHVGEAVDGVRRPPVGGGEIGQREEGAVDEAGGIEEDEFLRKMQTPRTRIATGASGYGAARSISGARQTGRPRPSA